MAGFACKPLLKPLEAAAKGFPIPDPMPGTKKPLESVLRGFRHPVRIHLIGQCPSKKILFVILK
jgi:hypothetical protein